MSRSDGFVRRSIEKRKAKMSTQTITAGKTCGSIRGRAVDLAGWIVPGALLVLIPKCPMCLAAYVALWTGVGLSVPATANLRLLLIIGCVIWLVFLLARQTHRLVARPARP